MQVVVDVHGGVGNKVVAKIDVQYIGQKIIADVPLLDQLLKVLAKTEVSLTCQVGDAGRTCNLIAKLLGQRPRQQIQVCMMVAVLQVLIKLARVLRIAGRAVVNHNR